MNRLTTEQSNLLKRLQEGSLLFSDLSAEDQEITRHLKDLGYVSTTSSTHSKSSAGMVQLWEEIDAVSIWDAGHSPIPDLDIYIQPCLILVIACNLSSILPDACCAFLYKLDLLSVSHDLSSHFLHKNTPQRCGAPHLLGRETGIEPAYLNSQSSIFTIRWPSPCWLFLNSCYTAFK